MRVVIEEGAVTIEGDPGAPAVEIPGLTEADIRILRTLRAMTWAADRLQDETATAVANHHTLRAIAVAKGY